ncbi:MAG: bifunctional folylpolyglutamate synthase/dihydrofolate synthase [Clostridia bacterium]|nr:bifunctional folylpolyglutamate synthase/dihydrofolate synthase [Clostridia bacterium]
MDYLEALKFIQKSGKFGSKLGLLNITNLMHELGDPQDKLRFVHVAGTNGKGSTALFISEILRSAGLKTGLYTSPFIYEFNERMKIDGKNIPDSDFSAVMEKVIAAINNMLKKNMEHPTEFEIITAAAFLYFYEQKCDVVVLEVGLGGRFDATNVIKNPLLCVITKIGIDHSEFLGNTLAEIAFEKCGIIKDGVFVVSYPDQRDEVIDEIKKNAALKNAQFAENDLSSLTIKKCDISGSNFSYKNMEVTLSQIGVYQILNAVTAINAALTLKNLGLNITEDNILSGLKNAKWPGRMEIISQNPVVILDGSHNADGIDAFVETAEKMLNGKKLICIFSMLKDKEYPYALCKLKNVTDDLILTEIASTRKASIDELLCEASGKFKNIYTEKDNEDAAKKALSLAKEDDVIVAIGSLYMLSDIKNAFLKNK